VPAVRVLSVSGVSAPRVDLTDVDLSRCRFLGLAHLDALHIRGRCAFATAPGHRPLARHARRRAVLSEDADGANAVRLAVLYRQLARATADAEGGPARDFRYRALELRRRSDPDQWRRWSLHLLWITCGYGLRVGRTVAWATVLTALVLGGATVAGRSHRHAAAHPRGTHHHPGSVRPAPSGGSTSHSPPRKTRNTAALRTVEGTSRTATRRL
jgi:hypothetical protein